MTLGGMNTKLFSFSISLEKEWSLATNFIVNCKLQLTCCAFCALRSNFSWCAVGALEFNMNHHRSQDSAQTHLLSTPESNQKTQLLGIGWIFLPKMMRQAGVYGSSLLISVLLAMATNIQYTSSVSSTLLATDRTNTLFNKQKDL